MKNVPSKDEAISILDRYIKIYQRGCSMYKETRRTYTTVACRSSQADIAKKAILLGLKVRFVNAIDVFRSMQVYY